MKKWIVVIIIVALTGYAIYDFVAKDNAPRLSQGEGLEKGDIAPDFELKTLSGESVALSDYRGKKLMLNFWATWCPPCRAEMPDMQKVQDEREDIIILAVNQVETESNQENIATFLKEIDIDFTVLLDENTFVGTMYQAKSLPLSYLINTDGTIEYIRNGPMNYDLMMKAFDDMH